ncbi:MAG: GDP-mannose 4,6-dehydratase [Acidimicrobiaceae bacterium]|nr:GDP-mannose 4,6-dehydratase [Acidimicrobiaceae bacterium]|tara:strand:+ start:10785 stop:11738 length:954 start_codon:yes stop_codon:yes gene_type:complete
MKVVITGGAGFVGSNLVRHLSTLPEVNQTVVIDDLSFGFRDNLNGCDTTLLEGSILDDDLLDRAFAGANVVVHLAARSSVPRSVAHPVAAHEVNATGTLRVLEASRRAGGLHVIVASSSSVYGANQTLPKHEDLATRPVSPYAATKLATESYTLAWGHAYDLPVLALRFFNIFGPRQPPLHAYAAAIPSFLAAAFRGDPLPVHGDGTQSRDFTYVATVVDVLARAILDRTSHPSPVNLAFGTSVSLLEIIGELERILGRSLAIQHQPLRIGDVSRSQADASTLQQLFPDVLPTSLAEGLEATVNWFEEARPWERPTG